MELLAERNSDLRYLIGSVARAAVRDYVEEYLEGEKAKFLIEKISQAQPVWTHDFQNDIEAFVDTRVDLRVERLIERRLDGLFPAIDPVVEAKKLKRVREGLEKKL